MMKEAGDMPKLLNLLQNLDKAIGGSIHYFSIYGDGLSTLFVQNSYGVTSVVIGDMAVKQILGVELSRLIRKSRSMQHDVRATPS